MHHTKSSTASLLPGLLAWSAGRYHTPTHPGHGSTPATEPSPLPSLGAMGRDSYGNTWGGCVHEIAVIKHLYQLVPAQYQLMEQWLFRVSSAVCWNLRCSEKKKIAPAVSQFANLWPNLYDLYDKLFTVPVQVLDNVRSTQFQGQQ